MQVETFEVTEQTDSGQSPAEICEEQIKLIEELGLEGQESLIRKPETKDEAASICPYRQMTAEEVGVYRQLCPEKTSIEKFAGHAIPLRVLQVAAHAKSLGIFTDLEVWHAKGASETKDPVLVAKRARDQFNSDLFLLARWGEELEPFAKLKPKAVKAARERRIAAIKNICEQAKRDIVRIEDTSDETILSWREGIPSYYSNDY